MDNELKQEIPKEFAPDGKPPVDEGKFNIPPIDPVVDFLSRIQISDAIDVELSACGWDQEKYKKYFKATDLFILQAIKGNVRCWEPDPNNPNAVAFDNLIKWFMYMIATNPWWHRKLCYFNRMMGVNTHSTSYWYLQYHPSYIPSPEWNNLEELEKPPEQFNNELVNQHGIYDWIDEEMEALDREDVKGMSEPKPKKVNPTRSRKKPRNRQ